MGLPLLLLVALVGLAVVRAYNLGGAKVWRETAEHFGLHFEVGGLLATPRIEGAVRGVRVRVEIATRTNNRNNRATTVYSGAHPTPLPPVSFRRQHAMSFLRQVIGGRDVVVGDPRFDDSIVVDAPDDVAIKEYLTPTRRAAILSVFSVWRDAELTDQHVAVRVSGRARNHAEMTATINRIVDTCRVLAQSAEVDEALRHREEGELHQAAAELHEVNDTPAPNVVVQMLEAETLVAAGEVGRAAPILDEAAAALPGDPVVTQMRESALAPPPPRPAAMPVEPTAAPLDQQSVIDDLFDPARYGSHIDEHFTSTYVDRPVSWSGVVEHSRGYRSDADFGTEPGTKATVTIGAVGGSALFSNRVKAVVDLPEDADPVRGETITFHGTLLHADRFTRTFFVRDATLENESS